MEKVGIDPYFLSTDLLSVFKTFTDVRMNNIVLPK